MTHDPQLVYFFQRTQLRAAGATAALRDHRPVIARVDRQVELDLLERGRKRLGQAIFTGLVLGCIETKFCKKICV